MNGKNGIEEKLEIPEGTDVTIEWPRVRVKGKKGEIEKEFKGPLLRFVEARKEGSSVIIKSLSRRRKVNALLGAICAHVKNMAEGVTSGYAYRLKIHYVHFPMTLEVKNEKVIIKNFLGERTLRRANIIGKTRVEQKKDEITVSGIDKEEVSQTAANIEHACRLSRKDRRVFLDGIYITEKALPMEGGNNA